MSGKSVAARLSEDVVIALATVNTGGTLWLRHTVVSDLKPINANESHESAILD